MNTSFTILLLFAVGVFNGQRFFYNYQYITDSTKLAAVGKELMVLNIGEKSSSFYSYEKYKADSVSNAELARQYATKSTDILINNTYRGRINYSVKKNYPNYKVITRTYVGGQDYDVKDDREIIWNILPETAVIADYKVQKAQTALYGRRWTAWFTNDIPLQDGPYKFHGLPGLIVKIEDDKRTHVFELNGVQKAYDKTEATELPQSKIITVTQPQYKKIFWENRRDPAKSLREMIMQDKDLKIIQNGIEMPAEQVLREREAKAKASQKSNNNPIELDMLYEN